MKDSLKFFPIVTFLAFLVKTMIIAASFPDALIIAALVCYVILDQLRLKDTKLATYDATIKELKQNHEKYELEIKNLQANLNGVKMGVGMRTLQGKS